jgi:hypothetical protein
MTFSTIFSRIPALVLALVLLTSCDAMVSMPYCIKNRSGQTVCIKVYQYTADQRMFAGGGKDTLVTIAPGRDFVLGWGHGIAMNQLSNKTVYRNNPGLDNFDLVVNGSAAPLDKSDQRWKFRGGTSWYFIRKSDLPETGKK